MNKLPLAILIFITIFVSSFTIASEISEFDVATYVLIGKNGQPSNMQMRLSQNKGKWVMEGREAPGEWKIISCDKGCEYRASTKQEEDKYLFSFPKAMQEKFEIACIQNIAQAFCRLTKKDDPQKGGYAIVALVTGTPTPMSLQRIPERAVANATEYGSYDPKLILTVSETPSGKKYGLDMAYLDKMLNDLETHAKNYPPKFDTPQDQQRATQDVKMLSGMLDILINEPTSNPELLLRAGLLNSIGHNLDIAGTAEKTVSIFQRLLAVAPSDPRGNYIYGTFLAGTGKPKEALPYLEKALAGGMTGADYAIGMTYVTLGDKQKALEYLEDYKRRKPSDGNVDKLIDAIRSGKIEFKKVSN